MKKPEFLEILQARLSTLPVPDLEERLDFYAESINDRMEDGLTEEQAVAALGSPDDIVAQILSDIPLTRLIKEKVRPKRRRSTLTITLIAVGSPIWLSLAIAALAVILSLYAALWSVVIALWATFAALVSGGFGGLVGGIGFAVGGQLLPGLALLAAGLTCAGLAILLFFGCKTATRGTAILAKRIVLGIKFAFVRKENKK